MKLLLIHTKQSEVYKQSVRLLALINPRLSCLTLLHFVDRGEGGAKTFEGPKIFPTLHIICIFDCYLTYFLLFILFPPTFCPNYIYDWGRGAVKARGPLPKGVNSLAIAFPKQS